MDVFSPTREIGSSKLTSVRKAITAALLIGGFAPIASQAQSCSPTCPPVTVYAGPISWSPGTSYLPAWYPPQWPTGSYNLEGTYQEPPVECAAWDRDHPRPPGCGAPPGAVTVNGCGPENFGWLVPDGDFGPACNAHDVCYSQFASDRTRCDGGLNDDMYATCEANYGCRYDAETHQEICEGSTQQLESCHSYRLTIMDGIGGYAAGVMASRFQTLQAEATCRVWHNARANESDCDAQ